MDPEIKKALDDIRGIIGKNVDVAERLEKIEAAANAGATDLKTMRTEIDTLKADLQKRENDLKELRQSHRERTLNGDPVQERRAGFVFQSYALFRHMTVFDNIAYGLRARPRKTRPHEAEIARRVTRLLELIKLPDIGARYPGQLSGGQRQRVALARALVPAFADQLPILDQHATNARVRAGGHQPLSGQLQGVRHPGAISGRGCLKHWIGHLCYP